MTATTVAVSRTVRGPFSIEQADIEAPRADEILVRIRGVGLCHTDIVARSGMIPIAFPAVFGHEGAGEVVAVGAQIRSIKVGDSVVLSFASCGHCRRCRAGSSAYCAHTAALNYSGARADGTSALSIGGQRLSGHFFAQSSFAGLAIAQESNAVVLPEGVDVSLMGPLGCGVQTGAGAVMNTLGCEAGSTLLITGGGSLGLSAVMAAAVRECAAIIVSEPHAGRRELALELGATHVLDPASSPLAEAVRGIVPAGVDYALDTSGNPAVIEAALASLGFHGTLALAGLPPTPDAALTIPLLKTVAYAQIIKGFSEGDATPKTFIPYLLELNRAGRFPFERLITRYPLSRINDAVRDHETGGCVKAVLIPD
jgi:aryl-alcohol dehydrogenase